MLALIYLGLAIALGDLLCPTFLPVRIRSPPLGSSHTGWHLAQHVVHVSGWAGFCPYN